MPASLIKHAIRAGAGSLDSYSPEGWNPKLKVLLMGPVGDSCRLVWNMCKPDGSAWFEHGAPVDELAEEEMQTIDLQRWEAGTDIDEAGECRFTLRLVNDLDGIDELLHDGVLRVSAVEGDKERRYAVENDWLAPLGLIALDTAGDTDGPKLNASVFLKGAVDTYQVEAHLFFEGKRIKKASSVESGWSGTANDGTALITEFTAEFDDVRGWNNLTDQNWGDPEWQVLDVNPGHYDVKFTREGKVCRIVGFDVSDAGQIVKVDRIEPTWNTNPTMWAAAEIQGDLDGAIDFTQLATGGAYGDLTNAGVDWNENGMYWHWAKRTAGEGGGEPGLEYDDATLEAIESFRFAATTFLRNWEADVSKDLGSLDGYDKSQLLTACSIIPDQYAAIPDKREAIAQVPDDHTIDFDGTPITIGDALARSRAVRDRSQDLIGAAAQGVEDELAPYRAVLANDKLAVFEDHSPPSQYEYLTVNKKEISGPEELAEAEYWFFWGPTDIQGTAEVDGNRVEVTVGGWRVLGWKFDADGNTIDEYEEQGEGTSPAKKWFKKF